MREILFRGKRIDNGKWIEGYLLKCPSAVQIGDCSPWYISIPPVDPDDNGGLWNVDPATVGQYTGLKDMNGKKIFEGDVIRYDTALAAVHYGTYPPSYDVAHTHCGFYIEWLVDTFLRIDLAFWINEREIEVVGNIYDQTA